MNKEEPETALEYLKKVLEIMKKTENKPTTERGEAVLTEQLDKETK
jgi:hypothetical protein